MFKNSVKVTKFREKDKNQSVSKRRNVTEAWRIHSQGDELYIYTFHILETDPNLTNSRNRSNRATILETLSRLATATRCISTQCRARKALPRALLIQFTTLVPLKARAAACATARLECDGDSRERICESGPETGGSRFAFVLQEAEVPCRAARRRVTWAAWAAGVAVTPPGARAPEARCRLSTTRVRRHPPGRARWSTIRIRTRPLTPIITRTRPGIIHRHRHPRRITQATCRSTPGTRRTLIPDYSRKLLFQIMNRSTLMEVWCIAFGSWRDKLLHL